MARGQLEEIRDVADGVWIWRVRHPEWTPDAHWNPIVTATCIESNGEIVLVDPIAPSDDAALFWERLDATPPTLLITLKPDHIRDVDYFAGHRDFRREYLFSGGFNPSIDTTVFQLTVLSVSNAIQRLLEQSHQRSR